MPSVPKPVSPRRCANHVRAISSDAKPSTPSAESIEIKLHRALQAARRFTGRKNRCIFWSFSRDPAAFRKLFVHVVSVCCASTLNLEIILTSPILLFGVS